MGVKDVIETIDGSSEALHRYQRILLDRLFIKVLQVALAVTYQASGLRALK